MQRWSIDSDAWLIYKDGDGLYVSYYEADYEREKLKEERDEIREQMIELCQEVVQGYSYSAFSTAHRFLALLDSRGGENYLE
jgi:hypothetical protein